MARTAITIDFEKYLPEVTGVPIEQVVETYLAGGYGEATTDLVTRYIVQSGYRFSPQNLPRLKAPFPYHHLVIKLDGQYAYAHVLADRGYRFSLPDLLALDNLADAYGVTIAHFMAWGGAFLTFEELLQLGNPADQYGGTLAHFMADAGFSFSVDQLIRLGNPDHFGSSIADKMVMRGHRFSVSDILRLGQPDLAFSMVWNGATFSEAEIQALGNPVKKFTGTLAEAMAKYQKIDLEPTTYRLVFEGDQPFFTQSDKWKNLKGCQLGIDFTHNDGSGFECNPSNRFILALERQPGGWSVSIQELYQENVYNYRYQKIALLELVQTLKQALAQQTPLDLSQAYAQLWSIDMLFMEVKE